MEQKVLKVLEFDKIVNKLAERTLTSLGREYALNLRPLSDYFEIKRSLKETTDAVDIIMKKGVFSLSGGEDIRMLLKRAERGGILSPKELLEVRDSLYCARKIKSFILADKIKIKEENIVRNRIISLYINRNIEDRINFSILNENDVSDRASLTLLEIRRKIHKQQNLIKEKLNSIIRSSRYQKFMQDAVVTIRKGRYVIPVKQEFKGDFPGVVHDISASGQTVFIEPMVVVEANNEIERLISKEKIEIERILAELTESVAKISVELSKNCIVFGKLDFALAKAKLSIDYRCVVPLLNEKRKILIKKGRHPLLDQKTVVPIDISLGINFFSLVITGPNTGGKTVTLKTVGLFTLMALSGLHLPACEGTEVGVFKKVFADIGDEQSIEQNLSTFSSHMKNIVHILKKADKESLVLFDELGAGTDPVEGAALAISILEELKGMDVRTIATTHYSELKIYAMSTEGVENACCEFDIKTLKPTFRLLVGVPGRSNAFAISQRLGLKGDIIKRAKEFLTQEDVKFEDILSDIEKNKREAEFEKRQAEQYRIEVEKYKNELENEKTKLEAKKDNIIRLARKQARSILKDARLEADKLLNKIKDLEKSQRLEQQHWNVQEIRTEIKKKIDKIDELLVEPKKPRESYLEVPKVLKPGETVVILTLDRKGIVLEPPNKDGQVQLQVGIMKMNVHISNLRKFDEQKKKTEKINLEIYTGVKPRAIKTELNLRGLNVDEALDKIDKYIDDAVISGLSEVTLIHGKGTGALRKGVHSFLKGHPHVDTYRLGKYGEGEDGVTIVKLR